MKRSAWPSWPRDDSIRSRQESRLLRRISGASLPKGLSLSRRHLAPKYNSEMKASYTCNRTGHLSRDCPTRRNDNAVPQGRKPAGTRLVSTTGSGSQSPSAAPGLLSHLLSSSDSETKGEGVQQVRIDDEGSKQQYAEVLIEGVPATGVVDSGAEITIMNGKLFARIAAVAHLLTEFRRPMIAVCSHSLDV